MCIDQIKKTREREILIEILKIVTSGSCSETIEELSKRLGVSAERIDCAVWNLHDTVYQLKHGSVCEEAELEGIN